MSILDRTNPAPQIPIADRVAKQIVDQARMMFQQLVFTYNEGAKSFWDNPIVAPQDIADALGTDAAEVFALHAKIGVMLESVRPDAIAPGKAVVGRFTINGDGSVTVSPSDQPSN